MKITEHFSSEEFDCKDGTEYPRAWIKERLFPLCEQLELIRSALGNKSITITSGYRSPAHNKKVGGASQSQHVQGRAADFKVEGVPAREVAKVVQKLIAEKKIIVGGLGSYENWVHVDIRENGPAYWRR